MYVFSILDSENLMNNNNWIEIYYDGWIIWMESYEWVERVMKVRWG